MLGCCAVCIVYSPRPITLTIMKASPTKNDSSRVACVVLEFTGIPTSITPSIGEKESGGGENEWASVWLCVFGYDKTWIGSVEHNASQEVFVMQISYICCLGGGLNVTYWLDSLPNIRIYDLWSKKRRKTNNTVNK